LDARESGDVAWINCEITCGCVAGAPREGTQSKAARRLLDARTTDSNGFFVFAPFPLSD
jgi:hypothetical protein